jgi:predicted SprT family Zn-dependent metalloprotease
MAWRTYDYACPNDQCEDHEKRQELLVDRDEKDDQRCGKCGMTMTRLVSATRGTHVSWSTWRI